jgi:hypothetical protein
VVKAYTVPTLTVKLVTPGGMVRTPALMVTPLDRSGFVIVLSYPVPPTRVPSMKPKVRFCVKADARSALMVKMAGLPAVTVAASLTDHAGTGSSSVIVPPVEGVPPIVRMMVSFVSSIVSAVVGIVTVQFDTAVGTTKSLPTTVTPLLHMALVSGLV